MATSSRIADSVGRVLGGRYRLTRPVGVGASAHVYAADDVRLRRRVAVKVLHPALAGEEPFLRRFRAEARVVASLRHAHILQVYDWGEDSGSPYLVTELLEGGSLRGMLDRGVRLSPAQAASLGADVAAALDHAHRQGLVHRDVKPANLLFDGDGRVAVADFGLARALAEAAWTEPAGAVVGTARYAAPEQAQGEQLDARADVYSLAVVLVEAMTGQVPFTADTAIGTLMARVGRPLPVPEEAGPLKGALDAAGSPDPAGRPDAGAFARALREAASLLPPPAPLPLVDLFELGVLDRDDLDPTRHPGGTELFDGERAVPSAPPPAPGAERPSTAGSRRRRRRWPFVAAGALLAAAAAAGAWYGLVGLPKPLEAVPSLVGDTARAAAAAAGRAHLHLAVRGRAYNARYRAGEVVAQTPSGGRIRQGGTLAVVLSLGPQPVPVPTGLDGDLQPAAEQALAALGLRYAVVDQTSMTVGAGEVISYRPDSGTLLPGQTVTLVVSVGKPKVAVPAVSGTYAQAAAALQAQGLAAAEEQVYSDTVKAGQVVATDPAAGTEITVGSTVAVEVSKGPHLVAVPDVAGQSVGAATQALQAAGFSVSGVTGNPLGTVSRTSPAAGAEVLYGSSVQIFTS
ncbi:MAG TPA: PASTA domain-containing protein [Acidimicrobiales bacterium]|nr:PASTA domain-containing protein [Acidimicrobiales bacterium]